MICFKLLELIVKNQSIDYENLLSLKVKLID